MSDAAEKLKAALLELPLPERLELVDFIYATLPPVPGVMAEGDPGFDEAKVRAALISDPDYTVALDLTSGDQTFTSDTTITFRCSQPGASTFIDLNAQSVSSIELNGRAVSPSAHNGHRIALARFRSAGGARRPVARSSLRAGRPWATNLVHTAG